MNSIIFLNWDQCLSSYNRNLMEKLLHYITCYFIGKISGKFKHSGVCTVLKFVKFAHKFWELMCKKACFLSYFMRNKTDPNFVLFHLHFLCNSRMSATRVNMLTRWTFFHFQVNLSFIYVHLAGFLFIGKHVVSRWKKTVFLFSLRYTFVTGVEKVIKFRKTPVSNFPDLSAIFGFQTLPSDARIKFLSRNDRE